MYVAILRLGLISQAHELLDLGCGIGILESWLRSAGTQYAAGVWPRDWPAPPAPTRLRGVDYDARDVHCARGALGELATFVCADARIAALGRPDAVVILDMLHYMEYEAQFEVLCNVRAAIKPSGVLVMRIGDADGGFPFKLSEWTDRIVRLARRGNTGRLYCRSLTGWRKLLERAGFRSDSVSMVARTPFANHLLIAQPA